MNPDGLYLFVYGTLKRGGCYHPLLGNQPFIQEARTQPLYRLYNLGPYPGLVHCPQNGVAIRGEIFLVDDATLVRLDELENVPRQYQREAINLEDCAFPAIAYFYQQDISRCPDCGDYWPITAS